MSETRVLTPRPTDEWPVVFTAQSKALFYCRDAVCEYTFRQNAVPLNPFRVFEYFLSDRVDRDAVRRGNNTLIRKADSVWVFGAIADGVLFEIIFARELGKPVSFFSIDTRATGIHPLLPDELTFEPEVYGRLKMGRDALTRWVLGESLPQLSLPFLSPDER